MGSQILLIFITTRWLSLHSLHWSLEYTVMNFYTFKLFQFSIFLQLSPSTSNSCSRSQVKYRNSFDTKYQSLWCSLKWAEMFWYFNINMQIWTWWFLDQTHQIWWRIFGSTHESINIILGAIQINFPNVSIIYPQSWNKLPWRWTMFGVLWCFPLDWGQIEILELRCHTHCGFSF